MSVQVEPESAPPLDLIPEARHRQRSRHRRRLIVVLVVLAVAAALVAWGVSSRSASSPPGAARPGIGGARSAPPPKEIVVWAQVSPSTLAIEVISTTTGHVIRTLATDNGLFRSTPLPSVSDNGTVYYDQGVTATEGPDAHPPVEQILSVPLSGGPSTFVAVGHDPQVSPNGQLLAYLSWTDITNAPEAVVVKNLSTGAISTWQFATNAPDINMISWSPDSRSLVVSSTAVVGRGPGSTLKPSIGRLTLLDPNRTLDDLPQISFPQCQIPPSWNGSDKYMAWAGFLNANEGIGDCYHDGLTPQDTWTQPVIVDLASGSVVRKLPTVPGLIGGGAGGGFQVDGSGQQLLFVGSGIGAGGLYRWAISSNRDRSQSRAILIKNAVGAAAWVPANLS